MDYDILLGLGFGIIFLICPLILTLLKFTLIIIYLLYFNHW